MTCADARSLLHAYADGELELARGLELEEHLHGCPACTRACTGLKALRGLLGAEPLRYPPPDGLRGKIRSALRRAEPPGASWRLRRGLAVAAAVALVALASWWFVRSWPRLSGDDRLAREVASAHVRSLLAEHLLDVKSADRHTVKPWFRGRLDFSPPVPDPAGKDFPLLGGRLDYLDGRPVASLVYGRRKHVINLFVWPAGATGDDAPRLRTWQGYQLCHWSQGGMTFWAVSDLNGEELREFAGLVRSQTPAAGDPAAGPGRD
jgi:anti-sigma factor RsiW